MLEICCGTDNAGRNVQDTELRADTTRDSTGYNITRAEYYPDAVHPSFWTQWKHGSSEHHLQGRRAPLDCPEGAFVVSERRIVPWPIGMGITN